MYFIYNYLYIKNLNGDTMRLLDREKINNMSPREKLKMIDNIKTSNLTIQEKDANLALLEPAYELQSKIVKDFIEGQADIDDLER